MDKEQIKIVMSIARPVITRLYGRQALKLVAYNIMQSKEYGPYTKLLVMIPKDLYIQVEGTESYKLKIYNGKVESISKGTLNL